MPGSDRAARPVVVALVCALALFGASVRAEPVEGLAAAPQNQGLARPDGAPRMRSWDYGRPDVPWGRLVTGTVAVVALICVGVYLLKKLNGGAPLTKGRYLEVLENRPVGRNVQLILVRVAGRVLLLAFGGENVTPVAEMSEAELPQATAQPAGFDGFKSLIRKLAGAER